MGEIAAVIVYVLYHVSVCNENILNALTRFFRAASILLSLILQGGRVANYYKISRSVSFTIDKASAFKDFFVYSTCEVFNN